MKIVALAGGVGGAKLADGLAQVLKTGDLTIVVNTGDDFEHLGLSISPDIDTVCYTLAGLANPETGWGRQGDSFRVLESLTVLGEEDWFQLGDLDLATHIERTIRLKSGQSLSQITQEFCTRWKVGPRVLPMSDQPVRTMVATAEFGDLPFQEYFVRHRSQPRVTGFRFAGAEAALPAPGLLEAIEAAHAVVICPSNPWVSIDPILSVPGIREAVGRKKVIGVSPIIGGKAVRGPAARMFENLGLQPSALAVAEHNRKLLNGFVFDQSDLNLLPGLQALGIQLVMTNTLMKSSADRLQLAQDVLNLLQSL
jgi:LPPG:FO 2-phospho-L-lactate transferase